MRGFFVGEARTTIVEDGIGSATQLDGQDTVRRLPCFPL
jgi:hypothetical protein